MYLARTNIELWRHNNQSEIYLVNMNTNNFNIHVQRLIHTKSTGKNKCETREWESENKQ